MTSAVVVVVGLRQTYDLRLALDRNLTRSEMRYFKGVVCRLGMSDKKEH